VLNGGKCLSTTHLSLKGIQAEKHPVRPVFFAFTQRQHYNRRLISSSPVAQVRGALPCPDAFHASSPRAHRAQHVPEEWTAQHHHMMNWNTLQVSVIYRTLLGIVVRFSERKYFTYFGVERQVLPSKFHRSQSALCVWCR